MADAEWIYGENETGADGWHCSECNFFEPWFYDFDNDIDFIKRYKYCPKCRRRMTSYTGKLEETKIIEQKLSSMPAPSYPVAYCGCDLSFESPKYKEDCYFYGETNDMGATIRFCTREKIEWGHCPCEKCDRFLSKEEVDRVARSLQKEVKHD